MAHKMIIPSFRFFSPTLFGSIEAFFVFVHFVWQRSWNRFINVVMHDSTEILIENKLYNHSVFALQAGDIVKDKLINIFRSHLKGWREGRENHDKNNQKAQLIYILLACKYIKCMIRTEKDHNHLQHDIVFLLSYPELDVSKDHNGWRKKYFVWGNHKTENVNDICCASSERISVKNIIFHFWRVFFPMQHKNVNNFASLFCHRWLVVSHSYIFVKISKNAVVSR